MHWTPLSGAKFDDVFGPSGTPARQNSRTRRDRTRIRPTIESLESRLTPAITAGIVATSLASTTGSNVTIGEIVRQRVVVQEPLSGNYDPAAFNVLAYLPAGLEFLPGTADMALVSANGITSTLDPNNSLGLDVTGGNVDVNSVTPTFGVPPTAISTDPTTGALIFNTGISHANDNGSTTDYVVIEFNAIVMNVAGNQAAPPTNLTTNFHVTIGGTTCNCLGTDTVTVVEPSITNLSKSAQVSADGSTATYTLMFSNTGDSTAYDVQVLDNPPAGLTLNLASVQVVGGTGLTDRSTATNLNLSFDSIAPGASVTITYSAAIAAADRTGQPLTNTVGLQYTSLPGPFGTSPNPTGTVTPGSPGVPDGERDGSGGINDYFDTAQATISVQSPHVNSLAGFVFVDENHSGDFDAGDLLVPGAVITLQDANGNPVTDINGNVVGPQTTDANGAFSFTNLKDGTYQLLESYDDAAHMLMDGNDFPGLINGVQDTTAKADPVPGDRIFNIVLTGGVAGTQYRFGECPCPPAPTVATINGFVYLDANKNGVKDTSEQGLAGVTVQLTDLNGNAVRDINGNLVGNLLTDANGFYQFLNLPAGSYRVNELLSQPTFQGQLTLEGATNVGTVNGVTRGVGFNDVITGITLAGGENSINNDFGEVLPSNVGAIILSGNVYFDANKDRVLDAGDTPVGGARLHLFRTDQPGGPVEVAQTTTNNLGQYLFEPDSPGTYMVTEDNVAGLIKEVANVGTVNGQPRGTAPAVDDLAGIALVDGDSGINYNFGLITNTPPPPPFSKQQLLANQPAGAGLANGVAAATAFATDPSFANIDKSSMTTKIVAVGADAGGGPAVRVFDFTTGKQLFSFFAYSPTFTGGVRVAVGDVNGDSTPDIITAPGAGGGPQIKVFDGKTGALIRSFWAFSPTFTGGVYVAAGDVNGDGIADIIVGAGAGGGPQVKVFDGKTGAVIANFYAFSPTFTGGVRVAAGDFNQDGRADLIAAAGPGGGPQVKIFNAATLGVVGAPLIANFYAFAPTFTGGVNVAANAFGQGDITGDGRTDLVVGTGSGAGEVKVIDGASFAVVSDFTAYDSSLTAGGVHVSVFDLNGDGRGDVVAGSGGGAGSFVRVVNVATKQDLEFFQAFNPAFLGGAWVASA
jgi:uncharacterized repeat protein (TIGR01451 family)